MPKVELEAKYPQKFLDEIAIFSYLAEKLSKRKFPVDKHTSRSFNKFLGIILYLTGTITFWLFVILNEIFKRIFKID